jgi:hypothetical protein
VNRIEARILSSVALPGLLGACTSTSSGDGWTILITGTKVQFKAIM